MQNIDGLLQNKDSIIQNKDLGLLIPVMLLSLNGVDSDTIRPKYICKLDVSRMSLDHFH
jgi:hypothetical protein